MVCITCSHFFGSVWWCHTHHPASRASDLCFWIKSRATGSIMRKRQQLWLICLHHVTSSHRLTGTLAVGFPGLHNWTPPHGCVPQSPRDTQCCQAAWWRQDSAGHWSLEDKRQVSWHPPVWTSSLLQAIGFPNSRFGQSKQQTSNNDVISVDGRVKLVYFGTVWAELQRFSPRGTCRPVTCSQVRPW